MEILYFRGARALLTPILRGFMDLSENQWNFAKFFKEVEVIQSYVKIHFFVVKTLVLETIFFDKKTRYVNLFYGNMLCIIVYLFHF